MKYADLAAKPPGEGSLEIRKRATAARKVQQEQFKDQKTFSNAQITPRLIRQHCEIDDDSRRHLEHAMTKMRLSARAYDRILKVSRTLADLDQCRTHSSQPYLRSHSISQLGSELLGMIVNRNASLPLRSNEHLLFKG